MENEQFRAQAMEPQTIFGKKSDSGFVAVAGFTFAVGFIFVGLVDRANVIALACCAIAVPLGVFVGSRALAETLVPGKLQISQTGFEISRAFRPRLQVLWSSVSRFSISYTYLNRPNIATCELRDGQRRFLRLPGANPDELVDRMNDYLERATGAREPTTDRATLDSPASFGHRSA